MSPWAYVYRGKRQYLVCFPENGTPTVVRRYDLGRGSGSWTQPIKADGKLGRELIEEARPLARVPLE